MISSRGKGQMLGQSEWMEEGRSVFCEVGFPPLQKTNNDEDDDTEQKSFPRVEEGLFFFFSFLESTDDDRKKDHDRGAVG